MFCYKCGTQSREGAVFCRNCGVKLMYVNTESQMQDVSASVVSEFDVHNIDQFEETKEIIKDSAITPYYRQQFMDIASGRKHDFNWAAFFWGGWNMLYNGCNRLFCMTYLPLLIASHVVQIVLQNGLDDDKRLIMLSIVGLCNVVLSIINGFKFNKWYYQDIVRNREKQRDRIGFWIFLACEITAFVLISSAGYESY